VRCSVHGGRCGRKNKESGSGAYRVEKTVAVAWTRCTWEGGLNRHVPPGDRRGGQVLAHGHDVRHCSERPVTHSCCWQGAWGLGARGRVPGKLGWSSSDAVVELLFERGERG
jgi:hypothetical protein